MTSWTGALSWLGSLVATAAVSSFVTWHIKARLDARQAASSRARLRARFHPVEVEHEGKSRFFLIDGEGPGRGPVEQLVEKPDEQIYALAPVVARTMETALNKAGDRWTVCFLIEPDVEPLVYEVDADFTWRRRLRGGAGLDQAGRQFLAAKSLAR